MHVIPAVAFLLAALPQQGRPTHRPEEIEHMLQETGFTLPRNAFEADLTIGRFEFDDFRRVRGLDVTQDFFVPELAYGVTDWLTVEGELPFLKVDPDPGSSESGIGDIALKGKVSLKQAAGNPIGFIPDIDVAAGVRITLPTGDEDEGLGEEEATFAPFVAASYWIERWVAVHGRAAVEWQQDLRPVHMFNATAEFVPWMSELSLFGGLAIERVGSDASAVMVIPGAEYRFPGTPLSVGLSLPIGVNDRAPDWGLILNGQFRF